MALIRATDTMVEFPVYGPAGRSLRRSLIHAATGGALARDDSQRVVVRALDRASFELRDGDRVGLVGHNGAGKTTMVRMLAGVYEPTHGELLTEGRIASMLSITLGMDPEATGLENIHTRGLIMGIPRQRLNGLIEEIVEFAGLGPYLYLPMHTYSSGMAMRLAFTVSTCVEADIVLMDEWLNVGDAEFTARAQERLGRLVSRAGILVLASHDPGLIRSQCNRVFRLEHGRLQTDLEL